jgi:acyl-CoA synthetase (AMP-forming)/AMP-acid ligase II
MQESLLDLLDHGKSDRVALVEPEGRSFSYESLRSHINRLGKDLMAQGITRNDRVAMVLPNNAEAVVAFLAVSSIAVAAPLNPGYKLDEFKFYLEDVDAKGLITSENIGEEARYACGNGIIQIGLTDDNGRLSFAIDKQQGSGDLIAPKVTDQALVLHTSGTTSRPKRVPLNHENLTRSVDNIVKTYQLTEEDVSFCVMPLFHVHGLVASVLATLSSGGTIVLPGKFNPMRFWPVLAEYRATWYSAVPSIHQVLLNRMRRDQKKPEGLENLRFIRSCSSALPSATMLEMEKIIQVPVLEAYGMTEAAHQMSSNPIPPGKRIPGTVGQGTGVEIGTMSDSGKLLGSGERGEVVIKGANVTLGYENNDEANKASFTEGWFRTGDEGVIDPQQYLTLVGRIKELINRSGEKISPLEIDDVLLGHPSVAEAVSFGVPHPTYGEEPAACVVLSAGTTSQDLVKYCREHLADFKVPKNIHIVDEIPKTATGKVQRRFVAAAFIKD